MPLRKVRSLHDWFTPLDGCPKCGYPYEREPGYYLMSIWAINYGFGAILGIALYAIFGWLYEWPLKEVLILVLTPVIFFNLFFARHSKSLFLALDLFCDPHHKKGGDDGGNLPANLPPKDNSPQPGKPLPVFSDSEGKEHTLAKL